MNGITININPVIAKFGSIELRWYSLAIITAIIAAVIIVSYEAKRKGIPQSFIYSASLWAVLGGIVGARLFHVLDNFSMYRSHPADILHVQQGGLAIWGALIGGLAATLIYSRLQRINVPRLLDAAVPALLVAQIIGRIGCIVNGDATGGVTGLPWGFIYVNPDASVPGNLFGLPTQPYPVYEMILNFASLLFLWKIRKRLGADGMLFWMYAGLYSIVRLSLTPLRHETVVFAGLQEAQVVALVGIAASTTALAYLWQKRRSSRRIQVSLPAK